VLGDERSAQTTPAAEPHDAKTSRPFQRFDAVEWGDDMPLDAGVLRADSRQGDDRALVVRTQRCHTPALAPDPNRVADMNRPAVWGTGFRRTSAVGCIRRARWRNLHRAFVARAQKLPHTVACGQKNNQFRAWEVDGNPNGNADASSEESGDLTRGTM
jgi:hypothetical protein